MARHTWLIGMMIAALLSGLVPTASQAQDTALVAAARGGAVIEFSAVSFEGYASVGGVGAPEQAPDQEEQEDKARQLFDDSRWFFGDDGTFAFAFGVAGVKPVLSGEWDEHDDVIQIEAGVDTAAADIGLAAAVVQSRDGRVVARVVLQEASTVRRTYIDQPLEAKSSWQLEFDLELTATADFDLPPLPGGTRRGAEVDSLNCPQEQAYVAEARDRLDRAYEILLTVEMSATVPAYRQATSDLEDLLAAQAAADLPPGGEDAQQAVLASLNNTYTFVGLSAAAIDLDVLLTDIRVLATEWPRAANALDVLPYVADWELDELLASCSDSGSRRTDRDEEDDRGGADPVGSIAFAAEDWQGGYYRGDNEWYGRAWVAVYGAASDYPRAALIFNLDETPEYDATFVFVGLDDERSARTTIAVEVNGVQLYAGPSPFEDWDGNLETQGADAAWSGVGLTIPAGHLVEGTNEIAVTNLETEANFGAPPWVLLAEAALELEPA